jgi:hypothetical protein
MTAPASGSRGRVYGAFALLVLAFGAGSWVAWWMVPVMALLWGGLRPLVRRPAVTAALATLVAWAAWLAADAILGRGAFGRITAGLSDLLGQPGPVLHAVTLAFATLLAWSGAVLGGAIGRRRA